MQQQMMMRQQQQMMLQQQQQQQQQQQSNAVLSEADFKLLQERLQAKRKREELGHAEGEQG